MRRWLGQRMVGGLLMLSGFPTWCAASDDLDSRKWHAGGSFTYLILFKAETELPLYRAQVQYAMRPSWTLDGAVGVSSTHLGVRNNESILRAFFPSGPQEERSTVVPLTLGATHHLRPASGQRTRGSVTAGLSLFTVYSRHVYSYPAGEHKVGWLIGPFGAIGIEIPVSATVSVELTVMELTYHITVNEFLRSVGGLVFGSGIGIRL